MTARLSVFFAFAGLMLSASPIAAQPQGAKVEAEIKRIAAHSEGTVGVSAIHIPSGRSVGFNADQRFEMASTLKLPLAIYALKLGEAGKIPLTTAFPVQREDMIEAGILYDHFRFPGVAISTLNAIELSVTVSDNSATDIIYSRVGGPTAVTAWLQSLGVSGIDMGPQTVRQTFAAGESPDSARDPLWRTATPEAMSELLARLQRGQVLGKTGTTTLLDIMGRTQGERISLQLPPGAKVRHKTGSLVGPDAFSINDVGLIEMPDGSAIAIAVFIKNSPKSVSHATRDKVIGGVSRAIYDYFLLAR